MNTNINEAMKPFFDQLGIDPIDFNYVENKKRFISTEAFYNNDSDPEAYYVVVKLIGNSGTVVIGTSDGIKFVETETLGQIYFDGSHWVTL